MRKRAQGESVWWCTYRVEQGREEGKGSEGRRVGPAVSVLGGMWNANSGLHLTDRYFTVSAVNF